MTPLGWGLVAAGAAVVVAVGLLVALLPWVIQGIVRALLWPRYRLDVVGGEHVPRRGPALIAANHVSWLDGFVMAATVPRRGRAVVNARFIERPVFGWLARRAGIIPVPVEGPGSQRAAIAAVRAAFDRGECVLLFPEGQISRNGMLGPFYRGLEVMLRGRDDVPVVPAYLDGLWGSLFSFSGGRFFRKWPRGWRRRVIVAFGPRVEAPATAFAVRQGVQQASVAARRRRAGGLALPETLDPALPRLEHPRLGLLAASTADVEHGGVRQTGRKPGSVGQAPPGVALRAVDEDGRPLPPDEAGRLQALVPDGTGWVDLDIRGHLDREGFLFLRSDED